MASEGQRCQPYDWPDRSDQRATIQLRVPTQDSAHPASAFKALYTSTQMAASTATIKWMMGTASQSRTHRRRSSKHRRKDSQSRLTAHWPDQICCRSGQAEPLYRRADPESPLITSTATPGKEARPATYNWIGIAPGAATYNWIGIVPGARLLQGPRKGNLMQWTA